MTDQHAAETATPRRWRWWSVALVTGVVVALYGRALGFQFINMDDPVIFLTNPFLRQLSGRNILAILNPHTTLPGEGMYIPLFYLISLVEMTWLHASPLAFHLTNLLLHLAACLLLLSLLRRCLKDELAALLGTLLFAVHPLQVETVAWAMGRKDSLATIGALAAIWCFLRFRETGRERWFIATCIAWILGLMGKPNIVLLPVVLAAIDFWRRQRWRPADLARGTLLAILALACLLLNRSAESGPAPQWPSYSWLSLLGVVGGWVQRFFLFASTDFYYLKHDALSPEALQLVRIVPALALAAWCALALRHRWPRCLMGILIIGVAMAPTASVILSERDFITADRYGYFAMTGACLAVAAGLAALSGRWRVIYAGGMVLWILIAGVASVPIIGAWRDSSHLWEAVLARNPDNPVALTAYGNWLDDQGQVNRAASMYQQALAADLFHTTAHTNLGSLYLYAGNPQRAALHFRYALRISPDNLEARYNLALACSQLGLWQQAVTETTRVLDRTPEHLEARYTRGMSLAELGQSAAAEADLLRVVKAQPAFAGAHLELGRLYRHEQRLADALNAIRTFLQLAPEQPVGYEEMARILLAADQPDDALKPLDHGLKRFPAHAPFYRLRAQALSASDRQAARQAYQRSIELGMPADPDLEAKLAN